MRCLTLLVCLISHTFAIQPTVIVHGGAGAVDVDRWAGKYKGVILAAQIGYNVLKSGGSSLDAVEAAIRSLEVDPYYNAGFGSALTENAEVEMDAMIMDGSDGPPGNREPLNMGAITGVKDIMHPITLARKVMEKTNYNFLSSNGAMDLARSEGFSFLPKGTLVTQYALNNLEEWRKEKNMTMNRRVGEGGTVGAVAIDEFGNIAAGTSTGGLTGKTSGRIGDSPIVGCGTYADNLLGGLSATGAGEIIMKSVLTFDILKRVEYLNETISNASQKACDEMLTRYGDDGGVIGLDKDGNVAIAFSSSQMSWAYQNNDQIVRFGLNDRVGLDYNIQECKNKNCLPPIPASA